MTSLQQIELALTIKVLRRHVEQIEQAFADKSPELVHDFVASLDKAVSELHDRLDDLLSKHGDA